MLPQDDHDLLIELRTDVKYIKERFLAIGNMVDGMPQAAYIKQKLAEIDDLREWKFKAIGAIGITVLLIEVLTHYWK